MILYSYEPILRKHINNVSNSNYISKFKEDCILFSAFPSCANTDLNTVVEAERHEAIQLNCAYHSTSKPVEFRWSMNSTNDYVDIPKSEFTVKVRILEMVVSGLDFQFGIEKPNPEINSGIFRD